MRTTVPDKQKAGPTRRGTGCRSRHGKGEITERSPGLTREGCSRASAAITPAKKTSWLKQYYPFSAEVKQTSLPFLPSKKVKLKTSTLVQTKQLMHIIQVNCRNRLKLYPEEGETVLYSSQDLPQHLSQLLCRVAIVFTWVFCCKSFTAQ